MSIVALTLSVSLALQVATRPTVAPSPAIKAPVVERIELHNGLRVSSVQFGTTPTTRVELVMRVGAVDEAIHEIAAAESVAEYLFEGTRHTSAADLTRRVSNMGVIGGDLGWAVGAYETVIFADVLSESVPALLRHLAELVQAPAFDEAALSRIKQNRLQRAASLRTQAANQATSRANQILFPDNPADRIATEEQINALTVQRLRAFHERNYVANRARLYIVGVFDEQAVHAAARDAFANWRRGDPAPPLPVSPAPRPGAADTAKPVIHLIHRPGASQARLHVAVPIVDQSHPDQLVINELNLIMGSVQTSRIIANVRERHGYSYNVGSRLARRPGSSQWVISADVARDVTGPALREILGELERLRVEPPDVSELKRYQAFMAGGLIYENSSARGVIETLRWLDLYGADPAYLSSFVQHVHAVQPTHIRDIIARYLTLNRFAIVVVGDRAVVRKQLEQIGPVVE